MPAAIILLAYAPLSAHSSVPASAFTFPGTAPNVSVPGPLMLPYQVTLIRLDTFASEATVRSLQKSKSWYTKVRTPSPSPTP